MWVFFLNSGLSVWGVQVVSVVCDGVVVWVVWLGSVVPVCSISHWGYGLIHQVESVPLHGVDVRSCVWYDSLFVPVIIRGILDYNIDDLVGLLGSGIDSNYLSNLSPTYPILIATYPILHTTWLYLIMDSCFCTNLSNIEHNLYSFYTQPTLFIPTYHYIYTTYHF